MNNKKIITKIWFWKNDKTSVWVDVKLRGTDNVPLQVRKHIGKEVQKAVLRITLEFEDEARNSGFAYDINDLDDNWFLTQEEQEEFAIEIREEIKRRKEEG